MVGRRETESCNISTPFQNERVCRQEFLHLMKMPETFSKLVENTVGKGEIAHYEQFLLFSQCFQKTCIADM